MVAVPFVRWEGETGEHLFVSGMTCDFWPAVWNGNFYYGFKKRLARMSRNGDHFSVSDDRHRLGFEAVLSGGGEATGPDAGSNTCSSGASGAWPPRRRRVRQSRFDWDFREATVDAASLSLALGQHFPELPFGAPRRVTTTPIGFAACAGASGGPTPAKARRQPYNSPDTGRA